MENSAETLGDQAQIATEPAPSTPVTQPEATQQTGTEVKPDQAAIQAAREREKQAREEQQKLAKELEETKRLLEEKELAELDDRAKLEKQLEKTNRELSTYREREQREANLRQYKETVQDILSTGKYPKAEKLIGGVLDKLLDDGVAPVWAETPEQMEKQFAIWEEAAGGIVGETPTVPMADNGANTQVPLADELKGLTSAQIAQKYPEFFKERPYQG